MASSPATPSVVLHIPTHQPPPACFYSAALSALRADSLERVLALSTAIADNGGGAASASDMMRHDAIARELKQKHNVDVLAVTAANVTRALDAAQYVALPALPPACDVHNMHVTHCGSQHRGQPQRAWRAMWTFCRASEPSTCELLNSSSPAAHVLVRTSPSHAHGHGCPSLDVRTSLAAGTGWLTLPPGSKTAATPASESMSPDDWQLHDVCVAYRKGGRNLQVMHLVQAHAPSGAILWPRRWPGHFEQVCIQTPQPSVIPQPSYL